METRKHNLVVDDKKHCTSLKNNSDTRHGYLVKFEIKAYIQTIVIKSAQTTNRSIVGSLNLYQQPILP